MLVSVLSTPPPLLHTQLDDWGVSERSICLIALCFQPRLHGEAIRAVDGRGRRAHCARQRQRYDVFFSFTMMYSVLKMLDFHLK